MGFYSDFIESAIEFEARQHGRHGADLVKALAAWRRKQDKRTYQHLAEHFVSSHIHIAFAMAQAKIVRMKAAQLDALHEAGPQPEIDLIRWMRLPYERIFIDLTDGFADLAGTFPPDHPHSKFKTRAVLIEQMTEVELEAMEDGEFKDRSGNATGLFRKDNRRVFQIAIFASDTKDYEMTCAAFGISHENALDIPIERDGRPANFLPGPDYYALRRQTSTAMAHLAVNIAMFLTSPAVSLEERKPSEKLNRKRAKAGKAPLPGWYEIAYKKSRSRPAETGSGADGPAFRHSFRYDVRGHFKHFRRGPLAGPVVWVPPHQRGLQNELYKPKAYRVDNEPETPVELWRG